MHEDAVEHGRCGIGPFGSDNQQGPRDFTSISLGDDLEPPPFRPVTAMGAHDDEIRACRFLQDCVYRGGCFVNHD